MNQEILSLRRDSPELISTLLRGEFVRHGELWIALPREVVYAANEIESVIFEVLPREGSVNVSQFEILLSAIRWKKLWAPGFVFLAVWIQGHLLGWNASWFEGCFSFFGILFLQIALNLFNDVEDYIRLIDLPRSSQGNKALQRGWISAKILKRGGYLAFSLSALCAIPVLIHGSYSLLGIALIAGAVGLGYSNPPFSMKYKLSGEVFLFLLFGPLLAIGLSQALFHQVNLTIVMLGMSFGFSFWSIAHVNNLNDINKDCSHGIQTFATRMGFNLSRHFLVVLYASACFSFLFVLKLSSQGIWLSLFSLCSLFWTSLFLKKVYQASGPASALWVPIREDAEKVFRLTGLWILMALTVQILTRS